MALNTTSGSNTKSRTAVQARRFVERVEVADQPVVRLATMVRFRFRQRARGQQQTQQQGGQCSEHRGPWPGSCASPWSTGRGPAFKSADCVTPSAGATRLQTRCFRQSPAGFLSFSRHHGTGLHAGWSAARFDGADGRYRLGHHCRWTAARQCGAAVGGAKARPLGRLQSSVGRASRPPCRREPAEPVAREGIAGSRP